ILGGLYTCSNSLGLGGAERFGIEMLIRANVQWCNLLKNASVSDWRIFTLEQPIGGGQIFLPVGRTQRCLTWGHITLVRIIVNKQAILNRTGLRQVTFTIYQHSRQSPYTRRGSTDHVMTISRQCIIWSDQSVDTTIAASSACTQDGEV